MINFVDLRAPIDHASAVTTVIDWRMEKTPFETLARRLGQQIRRAVWLYYPAEEEFLVRRALEIALLGQQQQPHRLAFLESD
ncbi:MAG TPA: hypothetical protein VIY90_09295 [Steroidobacteraceae bacterium]